MDGRAIALAIPFFFLLIGVELVADVRRRRRKAEPLYRFADSIGSLSSGIGQQTLQVLLWYKETLPTAIVAGAGGIVLAALGVWSGMLEGKRWATPLEGARLVAVGLLAFFIAPTLGWVTSAALGVVSGISMLALAGLVQRRPVGSPTSMARHESH